MKRKHYTIPVFIPEEACPFQCVYCNQKKITDKLKSPSEQKVKEIINSYLLTIPKNDAIIEVGYFGGNFTGISLDKQERYLNLIQSYIEEGRIHSIRLSTRPDYIDKVRLDLLKRYNVETVELGAQSMDDEVLQRSARGHTVDDTIRSSELIKDFGFRLGLQMMIGLPGDTFRKSFDSARKIAGIGAEDTRIYPCLIIKGTKLEEWYRDGKYEPLSLETAVKWSKEIYRFFEIKRVNVIRMGLHPSDGLLSGEELVAGPFHPSFKELVLTEIWNDLLKPLSWLQENNKITIIVPTEQINNAIGHQSKNKKFLIKYYKNVDFKTSPILHNREFSVQY